MFYWFSDDDRHSNYNLQMDIDMAPYPFPLAEESNEEFLKVSGDEFMMKGEIFN